MEFFDPLNSGDILNNIREIIHCPFCGFDYEVKDIKIMGRFAKNHVLHLTCSECGNKIMASVAYQGPGEPKLDIKSTPEDMHEIFEIAKKGSISDDEIMDFYKAIEEFDGNFQKIIEVKKLRN